jgi:DNA repair exonuclease SbcCD ATPase subunit
VKHDNYGTLRQKILDAQALVNQNGRAFRNARILDTYVAARLEELKWAVAAMELKAKAREEQRALREQIREEERAQKEFERAMRDAQKEEEMLRKAMEKAQRDVAKASDAQRAQYEAKLLELGERLRTAEEKNQRALSMAQQTRSGHVYVISNVGSFGENVYKIGMTRRLEPKDRIRELGDASVPFEFDVHALIPHEDAPTLERALHKVFVRAQMNKVNPRKEFFRVRLEDIRQEVERLGIAAQWTLEAECRDWRETQALERGLADGSVDEKAWLESQMKLPVVPALVDEEEVDAVA